MHASDVNVETPSTAPLGRLTLPNVRAAVWALRAARRVRRGLRRGGLDTALALPSPPPLPAGAERGVRAALARLGHTCLVESIVLQKWFAAQGDRRDLIVGVKRPSEEFEAHAWLEGEPSHGDGPFHEILRRPAT